MGRQCAHPEHTHELPDDAPANKIYVDDDTCGREARRIRSGTLRKARRSRRFWDRYRLIRRPVAAPWGNAANRGTVASAVALVALLTLGFAPSALAFQNGHARPSDLAHIAGGTNHAGKPQVAYLLHGHVAAAWNTMNLCAASDGVPLTPGPSTYSPAATAYRSYAIQVILKRQLGANAAIPGHSNHGNARAIDLRTLKMRGWIDNHGARFGVSKKTSDAQWEWWHVLVRPELVRFNRPDPGASFRFPNLQRGSGGACQAPAVKEVQRRLGLGQDGEYGKATVARVRVFQRKYKLHVDGKVQSKTWLRLRKVGRDLAPKRDPRSVGTLPGQTASMQGQDIRAVQGLLNARFKELHRGGYAVKVDGLTGPRFTTAVRRFQVLADRHGAKLKVTGVVNDATYARLLKPYAKPTQVLAVTGEGAALVAHFEGERLCPYRDAVGVPTQGYGHTAGVRLGDRCWTHAKALKTLQADLDRFAKGTTRLVKVRIGSRQFNAIVSWSFNVGLGAAASSTLIRELNQRHYAPAGNQFKAWNRAGGRVLPGLTVRRRGECHLYSKGSDARTRRGVHC